MYESLNQKKYYENLSNLENDSVEYEMTLSLSLSPSISLLLALMQLFERDELTSLAMFA